MSSPSDPKPSSSPPLQKFHAWMQTSGPLWVGILNATPDSFSDGGLFSDADLATKQVENLLQEGCTAVDIGGVSTRPGSPEVLPEEEWQRISPVLQKVRQEFPDLPISLDTSSPLVLQRATQEGWVDIANDVYSGRKVEQGKTTYQVAAEATLPLVLMHMQGTPLTMQQQPRYSNVTNEVFQTLETCALQAQSMGVPFVLLDPGIGFGKTFEHNLELLTSQSFQLLLSLGHPLFVGLSRKKFLWTWAQMQNLPEAEAYENPLARDALSKHFEWQCVGFGAKIIRTHRGPFAFPKTPR
jgi:dihydropteroate synthase